MKHNQSAALKRLSRIEGQVRGIARMIEEDRYCVDVLGQTAAIKSAIKAVEKLVIEDHTSHCIEDAINSGDAGEQRTKFMELIKIIEQAS